MAKKQFKAESKRLLDLMIHSIYTHKEIFLRELISNASDAMDKLYYHTLQSGNTGLAREDFHITLAADRDARTLTIRDNGCGMSKEDLEQNLGVIAKSGSLAFKNENEPADDVSIIGQFGVGFYAAFMVSDEVSVLSRAYGSDEAWRWQSTGSDGYTITAAEKPTHGTDIVLKIKPNTDDENYDEFLDPYRLESLVKKYSDYIRYPIQMDREHSRKKDGSDEYETYTETDVLNSMVPLWRKNKNEVTQEEYTNFYQDKFMDFSEPLRVIHSMGEGLSTYHALMFIPGAAPYNYYSRDFEKGLQLYSGGVMIMEKCPDLLPDAFSFIRGCVDSEDLSLNISREMLQHDRQLKTIAARLEKKIKSELLAMLQNDREKYETFWATFGRQIKYSLYSSFGASRDLLADLLLFYSSYEKKQVTLAEYVARMKEDQKYIYYASGDSCDRIDALPQTEMIKDRGFEILYFTEDVDEFTAKILGSFSEKEFKSVSADDLDLATDEEKAASEQKQKESQPLLEQIKAALADKVADVRLSGRLKSASVCLTTQGDISLEMERVLSGAPGGESVKAQRVLEINPDHPVFAALAGDYEKGGENIQNLAHLLYGQALLAEGMLPDDPAAFTTALNDLIASAK